MIKTPVKKNTNDQLLCYYYGNNTCGFVLMRFKRDVKINDISLRHHGGIYIFSTCVQIWPHLVKSKTYKNPILKRLPFETSSSLPVFVYLWQLLPLTKCCYNYRLYVNRHLLVIWFDLHWMDENSHITRF